MKFLPFLFLLLMVPACGSQSDKVQAPSSANEAVKRAETGSRTADINQTRSFGALDITITRVALEKGAIAVGMRLKNTGNKELRVYPDQGSVLVGNRQFEANMFHTEGDVSGEIYPGIEKVGSVGFEDKVGDIDPATIKQIDLRLGDIYDARFNKISLHWTIDLP